MKETKKGRLVLSTGQSFEGLSVGFAGPASGEVVFTTGMVGYAETLTDPSYYGQIVVFSYPLIGNYGVPIQTGGNLPEGFESEKIRAAAVIVSESSDDSSHWNSAKGFRVWVKEQGIPCLSGIDTRQLIRLTRGHGSVLGRIEEAEVGTAHEGSAHDFYDPGENDVLSFVSCRKPEVFGKGKVRIAVVDCGVKWNILRQLALLDCEIMRLPWDSDFESVDCSGWVFSNGPGNPQRTGDLVSRTQRLLQQKRPVLGICLGNQILALAAGARIQRLPYGHRSHNQPVVDLETGRGFITTQNHGYAVVKESLPAGWKLWFENLNDGSVEGFKHENLPFFGVQFHPEASAGPEDSGWILKDFVQKVKSSGA